MWKTDMKVKGIRCALYKYLTNDDEMKAHKPGRACILVSVWMSII